MSFLQANPEEFEEATDQFSFKKMLPRDERRFQTADLDGDLAADREEFTSFLHPEEFDHMKDMVVLVSVPFCTEMSSVDLDASLLLLS